MNMLSNLVTSNQYSKVTPLLSNGTAPPETALAKIYDRNGHQIMDFFTDYGTQRVSIDGDLASGKPVLMTYHDIGINHTGCFASFINMMRAYNPKWQYFTVVHIDAPQHHTSSDSNASFSHDDNIEAFDLLELCTQIEEIRSKLRIDRFLALGVGASCNIWTYYAMNYSARLRGMVLLNGIGSACGWREWMFDTAVSRLGSKSQFLRDSLQSSLLTRYFPRSVSHETYEFFLQEMNKMDTDSVIKFARGFARRKAFTQAQLFKVKTKTLVICGEQSRVKEDTVQFQKMMPKQHTTFVLMNDVGFLLTESHPQKLCSSLDLFIESLGLTEISLRSKFGPIEQPQERSTEQNPPMVNL